MTRRFAQQPDVSTAAAGDWSPAIAQCRRRTSTSCLARALTGASGRREIFADGLIGSPGGTVANDVSVADGHERRPSSVIAANPNANEASSRSSTPRARAKVARGIRSTTLPRRGPQMRMRRNCATSTMGPAQQRGVAGQTARNTTSDLTRRASDRRPASQRRPTTTARRSRSTHEFEHTARRSIGGTVDSDEFRFDAGRRNHAGRRDAASQFQLDVARVAHRRSTATTRRVAARIQSTVARGR